MCGSTEIDGYVFCSGLNLWKDCYEANPDLRSLIHPVMYLMRHSFLRPKWATRDDGKLSLNIRPLAELIDMYHTREATDRRDKVYALLAMSSDDATTRDLSPDYEIPWSTLLEKVVKSVLSERISLFTWDNQDLIVIQSKGCVLGNVNWVESDIAWSDRQSVEFTLTSPENSVSDRGWSYTYTLQSSARPIQKGDLVCLFDGTSRPTILRLCKDFCVVIAVVVSYSEDERAGSRDFRWADLIESVKDFPRGFLIVWDMGPPWREPISQIDYEVFMESLGLSKAQMGLESLPNAATRYLNVELIIKDTQRYAETLNNNLKQSDRR